MADAEPIYEVVSRKDAIARGLDHYFTGKPCKRGHLSRRRLATNQCRQCEIVYQREWKDKNKEHVRKRTRSQWEKSKDRINSNARLRYAKDPVKHVAKTRRNYWKDPERARARANELYYRDYARPEVREKAQRRTKQWAIDNPEKAKANAQLSRIKRKGINAEGFHTAEDIKRILKQQRGKCAYCKKKLKKYHLDHITPLAKGGTNFAKNIQATCPKCNLGKHARDPLFHARTLGMLL